MTDTPALSCEQVQRLDCGVAVLRRSDDGWALVAANRAYLSGITPESRDKVPGLRLPELLRGPLLEAVEASLVQARATGSAFEPLQHIELPGLGEHYYRWTAVSDPADPDTVTFVIFDLSDVAELRQRAAVEHAERAAIVGALREACVLLDRDLQIREANPAARQLLGAELIGRPWAEVVDSTGLRRLDGSKEHNTLLRATQGESPEAVEVLVGNDDHPRRCKMDARPVPLDDEIIGTVVVLTDVTEEQRLAAEHRSLLERELAVSTQARAEIAAEVHDGLAQTLTELSMMVDSAVAAELDPAMLTKVTERAAQQCRAILDGLRDSPAVDGVFAALHRFTDEWRRQRLLDVQLTVQELPRMAPWRESLLFGVIVESLRNALKHGDEPVSVSGRVDDGTVIVEICDSGPGINAADQHEAAAHGHLGLMLSTERMAALGGSFEIDSSSSGTTVRLRCPIT